MGIAVAVVACLVAAVLAQEQHPVVEREPISPVVLRDLPRPWILGDPSRPSLVVKGEVPSPWILGDLSRHSPLVKEEMTRPWVLGDFSRRPLVLKEEIPRPWIMGDLSRSHITEKVEENDVNRPWVLREMSRHYHPYRYYPFYPYQYKQLRTKPEDGKGVALHPGGSTSYVFPQVHGVGKRSAKPTAQAAANPDFAYGYHTGDYFPYRHYGLYNFPYQNYVYHRQLNKRSVGPQYSYSYPSKRPQDGNVGYNFRW
ncbi:uncharacterized protein [Procambarus clarkii]|uniref:uncharacterized protein n=1 Tax=Procambarus clarkii TaxID=6728 RepID=UPI003744A6DC